jgi:two-component system sensor histidine kinase AlgZ
VLQPVLAHQRYAVSVAAVLVVVGVVTTAVFMLLGEGQTATLGRWLVWAVAVAAICFVYFDYRSQRFSPALTEARLLALTARIRPHFLFNALNGVLGVIRTPMPAAIATMPGQ